MFDRSFFTDDIYRLVERVPGRRHVELTLHSGRAYWVHSVERADEGRVWLRAYTRGGPGERAQEFASELAAGRSGFDSSELVVAYDAIASVLAEPAYHSDHELFGVIPPPR